MRTSNLVFISKHICNRSLNVHVHSIIPSLLFSHSQLGVQWKLKVLYAKAVVFESDFCNQRNFLVPLKDPGKYTIFVQAQWHGKAIEPFRECYWYYTDAERSDYHHYLASYSGGTAGKLALAPLMYPYQNIAAVFLKRGAPLQQFTDRMAAECPSLHIQMISDQSRMGDCIVMLSEQPAAQCGDATVCFSGKAKYLHQFINGQHDISDAISLPELSDSIGCHSLFCGNINHFEITNDYFGTCPLFLYQSNSTAVVSNSYHLIAICTLALGVRLTLDVKTILPYFVTGERMLFEQLASLDTFLKKIRMLPIHSKCVFTAKNGLTIHDKPIGTVMRKQLPFQEAEYQRLLNKSADEIIDNINCILEDERIRHIIVDISGGKDSRVVLGALMNCDTTGKSIGINSKDITWKHDKIAFIPLNHIHSFPYNTAGVTYQTVSIREKDRMYRSTMLGTVFNRALPWQLSAKPCPAIQQVRLTGAGGDMLLCPYFPMSFPNISTDSIRHIAKEWALGYNNGIVHFKAMKKGVKRTIRRGLSHVCGNTAFDKFNNYYLYFRNAFHFGPETWLSETDVRELKWMPLYSKSLFLVRQMVSGRYKGIKVAVDLLQILQPKLLNIPFNTPEYNSELKLLRQKDTVLDSTLKQHPVTINMDETGWQTAQDQLLKNRVVIPNEEYSRSNQQWIASVCDLCLQRLNRILHYDPRFEKAIGLDLFVLLEQNRTVMQNRNMPKDLAILYNKLTTVCDLMDLIDATH